MLSWTISSMAGSADDDIFDEAAFEEDNELEGDEMEFDRGAIRCDFSEYPSALAAVGEYDGLDNKTGNHCEEAALEWLNDHTLTIPFDGGVIIQCF